MGDDPSSPTADLTPFVPRLIPEWISDIPRASHRSIDGTLVFIDLSGFTAMSERLAAAGKVGAEELTDHLDTIFSELITVGGSGGGSMLKFGGDALLILFWGDGHEYRAAWAALEMQETLGRIGLVDTTAGQSQLRMTVGAHSGSFDFFLAGTSHRALFVCGPDAATTVRVEGSAEAGEVRLSPQMAGRLDPSMLGDRDAHHPLLVGAPTPALEIPPWAPWPSGTSADDFVPRLLRTQLSTGVELTEHRQMSVGFLHLTNVDELIVEIGAVATSHHLNEMVTRVQDIFDAYDVAFISTDIAGGGPKIVCSTGAVRTFENDEERLLRALREVLDYPSPIDVRAGANRGHGFCGYVGPSFRRTFAVIGDVVNTAARVMGNATSGELLATLPMIDRSDTVFETNEVEPFAAKGKAEPVVAARIGAITGTRRTAQTVVPFVGRDGQLATLLAAVEAARSGDGRLVEVIGEPGIGKTRLVEETLRSASGMHVAQERCGRYAADTPYFPFRKLLGDAMASLEIPQIEARFAEVAPDLVEFLPLIALTLGLTVDTTDAIEQLSNAQRREKLHEVVAASIRALVTEPTVWFVDDAHWADSPSIELLKHLRSALPDVPMLICVTRRPEGGAIGGLELELAELDERAASSLVTSASGVHLLGQETERLTERARGNPLYLIELAAVVSQGGDLEQLPDSLEAVLGARIDSLPPAERLVLRQLAVLGSRFSGELAADVVDGLPAPDDAAWERLAEFIDVRSDEEWRFTQSLVRETAYEGLAFKDRRVIHHRAGDALERQLLDPLGFSELLSLHFHSAAAHTKSITYSSHAAERAKQAFAYAEAATFLARCVDGMRALEDPEGLGDALTGLARMELDLARYALSQEHYEESLEIKRDLGNLQGVAAQLSGLGLIARQQGEYDRARTLFEEALDVLQSLPDAESLSDALRNLGTVAWYQGRYDEARARFTESLEDERRVGNTRGIASALDTLGSVALALGDLTQAREHYREAFAINAEINFKPGISNALNNLGNVAFTSGDYNEARQRYEECLVVRRELRDRFGIGSTLTNLGTIAYFSDDFDLARERWRESLQIAREIGDQRGAAQNLHNLSEIENDPMEAMVLCQEGLTVRRSLGDQRGVAESLTTLGKLAGQRGNHLTARGRFIEAIGILQQLENKAGLAECLELIAGTCAATGDGVRAATLLGVVDRMCDEMDSARSWASDVRASVESNLREDLGVSVYEMTADVGRAMPFEQAIQLVREVLSDSGERATN